MGHPEILVIDDETAIRRLLEITLQSNGYSVTHAATGKAGLIEAARRSPDLIILDLGLPDESGHETLKKLREWSSRPIIILSVHSHEKDIIAALDNGANDYLVKPFRTGELLARIRSALRGTGPEDTRPLISFGAFEIDLSARTVKKGSESLKLTATQYALLALFGRNEGKVLTHQYLLREIWGADHIDQLQYLRVFIAQLRKKIEKDPNRPEHILTESGIGYRFIGEP
ncbi:MAG: response regulator [Bacteroidota bacterium]|nr:response regulator [Bacteroidota bacterium]MDP4216351.1 response regulator [Bacteroidota bacterium]MDP4248162.1 response regulator [Bacteroidota bacterium]MDP4255997.1 response regulator [Bacteroidota bacterium]MDP4257474.1 response regulator [Bacteroidota bacterium]